MPRQVRPTFTLTGQPDEIHIEVGPFGKSVSIASLFDQQFSEDQVRNNVRLAFRVGGYAQIDSFEFANAVNGPDGAGIQTPDGRKFVKRVELEDELAGTYRIWFGPRRGEEQFGIAMTSEYLHEPDTAPGSQPDWDSLIDNIRSFIRVQGYTSLTSQALAGLRSARWWVI